LNLAWSGFPFFDMDPLWPAIRTGLRVLDTEVFNQVPIREHAKRDLDLQLPSAFPVWRVSGVLEHDVFNRFCSIFLKAASSSFNIFAFCIGNQ
jgi:hypothetical protein